MEGEEGENRGRIRAGESLGVFLKEGDERSSINSYGKNCAISNSAQFCQHLGHSIFSANADTTETGYLARSGAGRASAFWLRLG